MATASFAIKTKSADKEPQNVEDPEDPEEALDHNFNDQGLNYDNFEDVTNPKPGTSRDAYPKPGPSKQNETIENPAPKDDVDETDAEEMTEEDMANKRLETLVTLFPQTDPEFLHKKAMEFGSDEDKMNQWIEESIELIKNFRQELIMKSGKMKPTCSINIQVHV